MFAASCALKKNNVSNDDISPFQLDLVLQPPLTAMYSFQAERCSHFALASTFNLTQRHPPKWSPNQHILIMTAAYVKVYKLAGVHNLVASNFKKLASNGHCI